MSNSHKPRLRVTNDGLVNLASGLGTSKSKSAQNTWTYALLNDYQQLDALYQSNWIARNIVDLRAEDMTREWRRIKTTDAEIVTDVEKELNLQKYVQTATQWSRLYGGGAILMLTDQDLTKPLDLNRIKKGSLKRLMAFDRWDLSAMQINTWDVLADNYLMPEYYIVRGGAMQIHHSHFARFIGKELPMRWQAITQGWGDSELRVCMEDIGDMVAAKGGISELMQEANIDTITREGLSDELASDMEDSIMKRYQTFSLMKSCVNMALLDGDEKLDRQTLNLSGVAPILSLFMTWTAGAAGYPETRLFGSAAKGLNATGEGDETNYHNSIRAAQISKLTGPLRKIDEVLVRSALGSWPASYDYEWNPLALPNSKEIADANKAKAETDEKYLMLGVVKKSQVQRELQANEQYQFNDDDIEALEELEGANPLDDLPPLENPDEKVELKEEVK
jgi:phage-related protein (TIGR01555 family)